MLSIITPCYNHENFLKRSIPSCLIQQCEKEIIIIDDGSLKPVENIWGEPVCVIRHEKNKGLSAALNTGIAASKGDRFVICSADDELHPNYAKEMLKVDSDIVSCDMKAGGSHHPMEPGSLEKLKQGNCHSYAALVKKKVWQKVGGFKETMNPSWEDYEFWFNCAKNGFKWQHVNKPLHIYNRNPKGRDAEAQGKDYLLWAKLHGYHQDVFGKGMGVVTFVIPLYDQEKYIPEALESIENQIYPHVNVVIVDDGSQGDISSYLKKHKHNIKIILARQENKHLSGARNTGIRVALHNFNSEYLIMLDADDTVHPLFVEETLIHYDPGYYVYSDIHLIGDANHDYKLPDFNCRVLAKRHIHPCTFLMESQMWKDVVLRRGYGYDEDMKEGWEDWEFALACMETGYCGRKINKPLFNYRNHANGSMRTSAEKIKTKLAHTIQHKHKWIVGSQDMPCSTCGGRNRFTTKMTFNSNGQVAMQVNIPGIGMVDGREPIKVFYSGPRSDTQIKIGKGIPGQGSANYRFNNKEFDPNNPSRPCNKFTIVAWDSHLFNGQHYKFSRFKQEIEEQIKQIERAPEDVEIIEVGNDDFTLIKGIGSKKAQQLKEAGFTSYNSILENLDKLKEVVGIQAENIQNKVKELV